MPPTPKLILSLAASMTQAPTPPPISDSSRGLRFRAVNYPTREQDPGPDPAPAMDENPTIRAGGGAGGQAHGGHGGHSSSRADAGPELTRRAVGPRLYHKKSRMGCLRCKARRVKVSCACCLFLLCIPRPAHPAEEWGVSQGGRGSLYMQVLSFVQRPRRLLLLLLLLSLTRRHLPTHTHLHMAKASTALIVLGRVSPTDSLLTCLDYVVR